jgi:hypothetical protein
VVLIGLSIQLMGSLVDKNHLGSNEIEMMRDTVFVDVSAIVVWK